jgi:cysteinyl-tRNA synthetase
MEQVSSDLLAGEHEQFVRAVLRFKMKFLEMMDDDFNTAGAIAVMHELASETNGLIERTRVEKEKQPDAIQAAAAATQTLKSLGQLLGLFRVKPKTTGAAEEPGVADHLMQLIISLRATARQKKDFATADAIRDGLGKLGITLEDRADGTIWRKD